MSPSEKVNLLRKKVYDTLKEFEAENPDLYVKHIQPINEWDVAQRASLHDLFLSVEIQRIPYMTEG